MSRSAKVSHSMLRLDATQKKRWIGFDFKFKKFSIKQAFFINDIFSSRVKARIPIRKVVWKLKEDWKKR